MSKKRQTRKEKLSAQSRRTQSIPPVLTQNSNTPAVNSLNDLKNLTHSIKQISSTNSVSFKNISHSQLVLQDLRKSIITSLLLLGLTLVLSIALQNNRVMELLNLP